MNTIGSRIKEWRKHLQLSQAQFAKKTGIPLTTLKGYELDNRAPGSDALSALAESGVNINWLLTGQGKIAQTGDIHKELPSELERFEARFERLIEAVLLIDPDRREAVLMEMLSRVEDAARLSELERIIKQQKDD